MNIYKYSLKKNKHKIDDSIIILGAFELIHKGHYELFKKAKEIAKENNLKLALMSFSNITDVYRKDKRELIDLENRLEIYASCGVDNLILIDFTKEVNKIGAKDFMLSLENNYSCKKFIMGQDFSVGNNKEWGSEQIKTFFENNAYVVDIQKENNLKISSTKIKQYFEIGEINLINSLIMHQLKIKYLFKNKELIFAKNQIRIQSGIYAVLVQNKNLLYQAILHINIHHKAAIHFLNETFELSNKNYSIVFSATLRIIVSNNFDSVSKNDTKQAINYFLNS